MSFKSFTSISILLDFSFSGENFIMLDNKDTLEPEESEDRVIMFATQQAMDFMANCTTLHMDGTVSSAPVLFDQIYVIHGEKFNYWLNKL